MKPDDIHLNTLQHLHQELQNNSNPPHAVLTHYREIPILSQLPATEQDRIIDQMKEQGWIDENGRRSVHLLPAGIAIAEQNAL